MLNAKKSKIILVVFVKASFVLLNRKVLTDL